MSVPTVVELEDRLDAVCWQIECDELRASDLPPALWHKIERGLGGRGIPRLNGLHRKLVAEDITERRLPANYRQRRLLQRRLAAARQREALALEVAL